jgi:hypothetical protein
LMIHFLGKGGFTNCIYQESVVVQLDDIFAKKRRFAYLDHAVIR